MAPFVRPEALVDHALETGLRHRLRRALRRMEGQHQHLRPLFAELDAAVRAGAGAEIGERLTRLRDALSAHFELEESVLFPALHGLSWRSAEVESFVSVGDAHDA